MGALAQGPCQRSATVSVSPASKDTGLSSFASRAAGLPAPPPVKSSHLSESGFSKAPSQVESASLPADPVHAAPPLTAASTLLSGLLAFGDVPSGGPLQSHDIE